MDPEELRARRKALGMTQQEIADALGVERVTVARWERKHKEIGNPTMLRLALERLEQLSPEERPSRSR